jgi:hypothetical protein
MRRDRLGGIAVRWALVALTVAAWLLSVAPATAATRPELDGPCVEACTTLRAAASEPPSATTTTRPQDERGGGARETVLPLVLGAIVFLALLASGPGYHTHGHWHSR